MPVHDMEGSNAVGTAPTVALREVVGVFHDEKALEAATDELQECGFDRAEISLLASERAVAEKLGHAYTKVAELEDDGAAARAAYVSREDYGAAEGGLISALFYVGALAGAGAVVASGGALGAVLLVAALSGGTGGVVGLGLARWLEHRRVEQLGRQIEKGGLIVWVHVDSADREKQAIDVFHRCGAEDIHAHEIPAEADTESLAPYPPLLRLVESMARHRKSPGISH